MAKQRILLVDDEPDIVEVLKFRLEQAGYEIIIARDGIEALEKAYIEVPDLIVLDIVMPKMDGYQVCKALKESRNEKYSSMPIIMITAQAKLADERAQAASSADDFVVKPFEAEELLGKIKRLL